MPANETFHSDAPYPTARTIWLRTFLPFQIVRFFWLNLRMLKMVGRAHGR
jgi:hypothetical protein